MIKIALWGFLFVYFWWKISGADPSQDWNNSPVSPQGNLPSTSYPLSLPQSKQESMCYAFFICSKLPGPRSLYSIILSGVLLYLFGPKWVGSSLLTWFWTWGSPVSAGHRMSLFLSLFKYPVPLWIPLPCFFYGTLDVLCFFCSLYMNMFSADGVTGFLTQGNVPFHV